jgi:hypothetical protein
MICDRFHALRYQGQVGDPGKVLEATFTGREALLLMYRRLVGQSGLS